MTYVHLILLLVAIGAALIWWLGITISRRQGRESRREAEQARKTLRTLHDLAGRVAAEVDGHSRRVGTINQELLSVEAPDAKLLLRTTNDLIRINEELKQQLDAAKAKLHEQARQMESHAAAARTDPLTGLANRRALDDEMARRVAEFRRYGRPMSLVLLDVDHFKKFNDSHGHAAGDAVLCGVADVLRQALRESDLPARYGGEEFAVILTETSTEAAIAAAERVRSTLDRARFEYDGKTLAVSASHGVATLLPDEDPTALFRRVDEALYASKKAGRNCTHWHDGRQSHCVTARESSSACPREDAAGPDPAPEHLPSPDSKPAAKPPSPPTAPITGNVPGKLADRHFFCQAVRRHLAARRRSDDPFSVLLVEVESGRQRSDPVDRDTEERLLRGVGDLLHGLASEAELIARYTLTSYALLLPGVWLTAAQALARRVEHAAGTRSPSRQETAPCVLQFGAAEASERDDLISLLQRAETALHGDSPQADPPRQPALAGAELE